MSKIENRKYITALLDQCYCDQENIYIYFCGDANCKFWKKANILEEQLRTKKINTLNSEVHVWKITYSKNGPIVLTIIPVH